MAVDHRFTLVPPPECRFHLDGPTLASKIRTALDTGRHSRPELALPQLLALIRGAAAGDGQDQAAGRPRGHRAPRAGVDGTNTAASGAEVLPAACRDPVRGEEVESLVAPLLRPLTRDSGHVDHQPLLVITCLLASLDGASRFQALVRSFALGGATGTLTPAEASLLSGAVQRAASAFWPLWSAGGSAPRADAVDRALVRGERSDAVRFRPLTPLLAGPRFAQRRSPSVDAAVEDVLADDDWFGLLQALPARLEAAAAVRPAAGEASASTRARAPPRCSAPLAASARLEQIAHGVGSDVDLGEGVAFDTDSSSEEEVGTDKSACRAGSSSVDPASGRLRRRGPWWGIQAWREGGVECVDPTASQPLPGALCEGHDALAVISAPQGPSPPPSWLRVPPPVAPRSELEWVHGVCPSQAARGVLAFRDPAHDEELVAAPAGRAVVLHPAGEAAQRAYLGHAGRVACVAASDDGATLASGHVAYAPVPPSAAVPLVHVWRPSSMEPLALLLPSSPRWRGALQLAFCGPSQRYILVAAALWQGAAPDAAPVGRSHPTAVADECGSTDRSRRRNAHELVLLDWRQRRVLWTHVAPSATV